MTCTIEAQLQRCKTIRMKIDRQNLRNVAPKKPWKHLHSDSSRDKPRLNSDELGLSKLCLIPAFLSAGSCRVAHRLRVETIVFPALGRFRLVALALGGPKA